VPPEEVEEQGEKKAQEEHRPAALTLPDSLR